MNNAMIIPEIKILQEKRLVGKYLKMSLINNKTRELWGGFHPLVQELGLGLNVDKISLQVYPDNYFNSFDPNLEFVKWAAIEVSDFKNVPKEFNTFVLSGGLYAVFDYTGSSSNKSIFDYIYSTWIPNSKYHLDNRPHFEVLGTKYKNNDPDSEEEIWIPINPK
jgi:AraC family transcriptional regulator